MKSKIKDIALAPSGHDKINWVKNFMPVMNAIEKEYSVTKPFAGKRMVMTMHLEAKTAYLALVLQAAGAEVIATASNPLSTQDDVCAALVEGGVTVFAHHGCTMEEYDAYIDMALDCQPDIIMDDGGDLIYRLHNERRELLPKIIGGSEETTTGVIRDRALEAAGKLEFPMLAANDAYLITATAPASPPGRASCAPPIWLSLARPWLLLAMAGAARAVPCVPRGWVPMLSSPRWTRLRLLRQYLTASA